MSRSARIRAERPEMQALSTTIGTVANPNFSERSFALLTGRKRSFSCPELNNSTFPFVVLRMRTVCSGENGTFSSVTASFIDLHANDSMRVRFCSEAAAVCSSLNKEAMKSVGIFQRPCHRRTDEHPCDTALKLASEVLPKGEKMLYDNTETMTIARSKNQNNCTTARDISSTRSLTLGHIHQLIAVFVVSLEPLCHNLRPPRKLYIL